MVSRRAKEEEFDDSKKKITKSKKQEKLLADNLPIVCLSVKYKDKRIKISEDRFTASGDKGYTTICSTHGALKGNYYYEAQVLEPEEKDGHLRIGWSTRRTRFDMPIGSDLFSYAVRDKDGDRVSQGMRTGYGEKIIPGDVIGCMLSLPVDSHNESIEYEDPLWLPGLLCDPQSPPIPSVLNESSIEYTINGVSQGTAFVNVVDGAYYPAVSLFNKGKVKVNFGPNFKHQPPKGYLPVCSLFDAHSHMKPPRRPPTYIPRGALEDQISSM